MITARLSSKNQAVVPSAVRKHLDIHSGDTVAFTIEGDTVRLSRITVTPHKYSLQQLVGSITPENLHEAWDDSPQGEELL
ncbi:MAG: AbrB/MazE/SpoVT family DNA-binding domain-containing protein [Alphaproteobacteria bacterium]